MRTTHDVFHVAIPVHDLDAATPEQALPEIEDHVRALVARLQSPA